MTVQQWEEFTGWLLDVSTQGSGVLLWVKRKDNEKVIPVEGEFFPEFFAVPRPSAGNDLKRLRAILEAHPNVKKVRACKKYVKLEDPEKTTVFGVSVKKPSLFKKTVEDTNNIDLFTLFNTDLPISQMYFYVNDLFPMVFCRFIAEKTRDRKKIGPLFKLKALELRDTNETLFYDLPPLTAVWLDVVVQKRELRPYHSDPLSHVKVSIVENDKNFNIPRSDGVKKRTILIDKADEAETLRTLSKVIEKLDPDIILTQGGDEFVFPYLAARASVNHVSRELYFSRDKTPLAQCIFKLSSGTDHYMSYGIIRRRSKTQVYFTGRFHLDTTTYGSLHFSEGNIPGVIEVARISRVPLQRLCRVTIGGALQSIQFYNAYKLNYLIPPFKKNPEDFRSGLDLIRGDRGGHIFEPLIGVFDHVVELDFSSMYPSLMANYNISAETLNCKCCEHDGTGIKVPGLDFHICSKREGIISKSIKLPLKKRLRCKEYVRQTGSLRYKFTDIALKWVLVVSFGYLGFKNARFGKIEAHQAVCAFAREILMHATKIAESHGCKILHGIVDSLWLQDLKGRDPREFEEETKQIAEEISRETGIPMSWEGFFDFIVFLPSRAEPTVPTLNHYWGIKTNGEIKARGIDIRRHDTPNIVKKAQKEFMEVFKGVKTTKEFMEKMPRAKELFSNYVSQIQSGKVSKEELSIHQKVSRKPSQYKVNSYQAVAAKQLEASGVIVTPGKTVNYIIMKADADPYFPEKKVRLTELYDDKKHQYDKQKYVELLKRAFENLFPFEVRELDVLTKSKRDDHRFEQKSLDSFL
ncbi:MAG: DNA polymerase domain-containing protein [Promethearchaeota archaeon]